MIEEMGDEVKKQQRGSGGSPRHSLTRRPKKVMVKFQVWMYEKALLFSIVTMLAVEPLFKRL